MKYRLLLILSISASIFFSCQEPKKKTFEEQALELIKEVEKKNKIENKAKLEKNVFSEGVQEIIEYFDYVEPLIAQYSDIKVIKSTSDFNNLKNKNPSTIKSIYIDNYDTEIIIDDISILSNLEYLKVRSIDTLPNGFYKLRKLKAFLAANDLKCKIDKRITNLRNLEYIQLLFTYTELPAEIELLNNLKTIRFYNFNYNQPYQNIFNIPNLKTLWIKFSDNSQLDGISNLLKLRTLITNKVSPEIGKLNLTGLNINENSDETYPNELGQLQSLVALHWQGNNVKESAPNFIASLKNLEYLEIRGCSKFNQIPINFDSLNSLKQFDIICRPKFNGNISHLKNIKTKINVK